MSLEYKRLLLSLGLALGMSLIVWLNISEASPAYRYLLQQPEFGYALLVLNLPALFACNVFAGSPPTPFAVCLACSVQWFALGLVLSSFIWREPGDRT